MSKTKDRFYRPYFKSTRCVSNVCIGLALVVFQVKDNDSMGCINKFHHIIIGRNILIKYDWKQQLILTNP